jgi:rhodanese-related sulfurtransferase
MKRLHFTLNQKLALVVGLLGFFAIFAGNPYRGNTATMNVKELGLLVDKQADHVLVDDVADWIIKGRVDYRLVDVRTEKEFHEYHIPTAENIPVGSLLDGSLQRNDKIVLCSEGGTHAAQAWFLLRAQRFHNAYILKDGLAEWKDKILFPALAENASPEEKSAFEKRKAVSAFFGGTPQTGTAGTKTVPQMSMPKLDMPAASVPQGGTPIKKKEGC